MVERSDNKRKKNWFIFIVFFFSIIVSVLSIVTLFYIFKFRYSFSSLEFYIFLIIDALLIIYSLVIIGWSVYKIFRETEQICFPYPTLTPFIFGYSESQVNPSQKMFGVVNK